MQHVSGSPVYSATDLSRFLACGQLALLERRELDGGPKAPVYADRTLESSRGRDHMANDRYVVAPAPLVPFPPYGARPMCRLVLIRHVLALTGVTPDDAQC